MITRRQLVTRVFGLAAVTAGVAPIVRAERPLDADESAVARVHAGDVVNVDLDGTVFVEGQREGRGR